MSTHRYVTARQGFPRKLVALRQSRISFGFGQNTVLSDQAKRFTANTNHYLTDNQKLSINWQCVCKKMGKVIRQFLYQKTPTKHRCFMRYLVFDYIGKKRRYLAGVPLPTFLLTHRVRSSTFSTSNIFSLLLYVNNSTIKRFCK